MIILNSRLACRFMAGVISFHFYQKSAAQGGEHGEKMQYFKLPPSY
jgi:hypothetical protein